MRCTERRLTPAASASSRPVQWVVSPGGGPKAEIDHPLNGVGRRTGACQACASCRRRPSTPCHRAPAGPHHRLRFTGPAHDLGSAAAVGGGKDNLGAPHVLLWCAAIRNDRLKPEAICSRDVDDNSCSHRASTASADLGIVRTNQTTRGVGGICLRNLRKSARS